ncbi:MAG: hypothetical protein M1396_01895 [Chloroflexi bacterium]|nr:hypothetical protein [Chloroflexota bacterium]
MPPGLQPLSDEQSTADVTSLDDLTAWSTHSNPQRPHSPWRCCQPLPARSHPLAGPI